MKILYVQTIVRLQYDTGPVLNYRPVRLSVTTISCGFMRFLGF